jgi:hypothetical protein
LENKPQISLNFFRDLLKGKTTGQIDDAITEDATQNAIQPSLNTRSKILAKLEKLNEQARNRQPFTLENPPILDTNSNWLDWEAAVLGIEPPAEFDNIHLHPLESNDTRDLFLAFVKDMVPEEVHHDVIERIMLIDGTCECHIWTEVGDKSLVRMQAGDIIELKLGEIHDIYITSAQPAKAILQWLKVAA